MLCGTAYSQEKPISSQDWRVDRDSPPRMDAMEPEIKHDRHGHSLPPWLDYNLDNGFAFLGADLKSKPKDTRVLLEDWSDRHYGASYPRMELYTLFPAFGRLYCFDKTVDKNGKVYISASRLDDREMPPGVKVGQKTYIFPMRIVSFSKETGVSDYTDVSSGRLTENMIVVGPIKQDGAGKDTQLTAKVITSADLHALCKYDNEIDWQVVRVGDIVTFGKWDRHRVTNIVPPNNQGYKVRGHVCKMLGWIELDRKPQRDDTQED